MPDAVLDAGGLRAGGFDCFLLDASAIVVSRSSETALIRVASASGSCFTIFCTSTLTDAAPEQSKFIASVTE